MVVGVSLVFEGQATEADMVEVLEPLEVGHCHTTSVSVQVGDDENVAFLEDGVSSNCGGTVGSFSYNL